MVVLFPDYSALLIVSFSVQIYSKGYQQYCSDLFFLSSHCLILDEILRHRYRPVFQRHWTYSGIFFRNFVAIYEKRLTFLENKTFNAIVFLLSLIVLIIAQLSQYVFIFSFTASVALFCAAIGLSVKQQAIFDIYRQAQPLFIRL